MRMIPEALRLAEEAHVFREQEKWAQAWRCYEEILNLPVIPDDRAKTYANLMQMYEKQGNIEGAVEAALNAYEVIQESRFYQTNEGAHLRDVVGRFLLRLRAQHAGTNRLKDPALVAKLLHIIDPQLVGRESTSPFLGARPHMNTFASILVVAGILAAIHIAAAALMTRWLSDWFCIILTILFAVYWGVVQVKKAGNHPATRVDPHFQRQSRDILGFSDPAFFGGRGLFAVYSRNHRRVPSLGVLPLAGPLVRVAMKGGQIPPNPAAQADG